MYFNIIVLFILRTHSLIDQSPMQFLKNLVHHKKSDKIKFCSDAPSVNLFFSQNLPEE